MDFATLLMIATMPDGSKKSIGGLPVATEECRTFVGVNKPGYRITNVCVRVPVWVINPRYWKAYGKNLYFRSDTNPWTPELTSAETASIARSKQDPAVASQSPSQAARPAPSTVAP